MHYLTEIKYKQYPQAQQLYIDKPLVSLAE